MTIDYEMLGRQLEALATSDKDRLALSANFVALLYAEMPDINWLGLYVARGKELVLGPFQGLPPACAYLSARAFAGRPQRRWRHSESPMSTRSRGILPATRPQMPSSSFRWYRRAR